MIILRRDVIRVMREALERLVGDQAAPFLSFLASGVGIHEGSIFRDSITSTGQEQRASLENLVHSAFEDTNLGLGKIKIQKLDFDAATADVVIGNCFEAMENGSSEDPNCMFTSGFLAGLFAEVFDKTLQARETQCISQGEAECVFQIFPADSPPGETANVDEPKKEVPEASVSKVEETPSAEKHVTASDAGQESKSAAKPAALVKEDAPKDKAQAVSQSEVDAGVERASRIARRKQGFWEKHFKKK